MLVGSGMLLISAESLKLILGYLHKHFSARGLTPDEKCLC